MSEETLSNIQTLFLTLIKERVVHMDSDCQAFIDHLLRGPLTVWITRDTFSMITFSLDPQKFQNCSWENKVAIIHQCMYITPMENN